MNPTLHCQAYRPAVCSDRPTTLQLWLRLEAPAMNGQIHRPPLNLSLAIDRSGSMAGPQMEHAIEAAIHLLHSLQPSDRVSVIAFDNIIEVIAPCRQVGNPADIVACLRSIGARGGTALHQGWLEACHQAQRGAEPSRLSRVILLSDGQANEGLSDPVRIAAEAANWRAKGITTTTVGLGLGYNEDLLAAMATAGGGNFFHVESAAQIEPYFALELQGLSRTYGRALELEIEPLAGIELLRVLNPLERTPGGALKLADLVHGCPVDVVLEFLVPAMSREVDLCRFRLAWTEVESGRGQRMAQNFRLPVVPHGQLSEFPVCLEVMRKRAIQLTGLALKKAVALIDRHDYAQAKIAIEEALGVVREADPSPELEQQTEQLTKLLGSLNQGSYGSVRKEATYSSRSMGSSGFSGSIVLSGLPGLKEFMALPESERTAAKFQELLGLPPTEPRS